LSTLKSFFRETAIYGIAAVLPRMINLLLVIIHTAVFRPEQYSDNTIWYVYAAYLNVILTLGLETSFFRYYTSESDKKKVLSTAFLILCIMSSAFLLISFIFTSPLSSFFNFPDSAFLKILALTVAVDTLTVIPFAYLRVSGKALRFTFIRVFNVVVLLLINYFLLILIPGHYKQFFIRLPFLDTSLTSDPQVIYIFIANLSASVITLLMVLPYIIKIRLSFDKSLMVKFMQYGIPIMIGGIAYVTNENLDKLFIERISGKEANGIYAACYKLGVFMTLYITAFRMGAEPFFFNHASTADAREKYSRIMHWFVILGALFMLGVVCFMDLFARILIKDSVYYAGLSIVPVILLANLCSGIYNNLSVWYKLTDKTKAGMYISITGGLLTVIFLWILVPAYGYQGAAWTTLIAYGSMMLISWYVGSKYYPVPYNIREIILYISVSVILSMLSYHFFRGYYIVNFFIVAGYVLLIFLRENLFKLLSTSKN
jgi:O-antigen/teichoic acid export membrane protein